MPDRRALTVRRNGARVSPWPVCPRRAGFAVAAAGYHHGMPRAIWTGAISFGLVNVPVRLFPATEQKDIHFNQFQAGTGERIRNKRVAEESGEEVAYEDIVKGYEVDDGRFVIVTPDELESVEPGRTRTIEIEDFVDLDAIDPVYFEKSYYLAPTGGSGADRPYALLRTAREEARKVGVGRFVLRTKQYLVAIRASGDALVLETMYFADEVRDPGAIDDLPGKVQLSSRERAVAGQLIESLSTDWKPGRYHDTYRERVLELIKRKAEGEEVVVERPAAEEEAVTDLMAALEASLEAARGGGKARSGKAPKGRKGGKGGEGTAGEGVRGGRYESMSKDELYERASEAGVKGRSKMTREELAEALREAS